MSPGRLFVTGGTGYIGGVLIELAVAEGYKVSSPISCSELMQTLLCLESTQWSCGMSALG